MIQGEYTELCFFFKMTIIKLIEAINYMLIDFNVEVVIFMAGEHETQKKKEKKNFIHVRSQDSSI